MAQQTWIQKKKQNKQKQGNDFKLNDSCWGSLNPMTEIIRGQARHAHFREGHGEIKSAVPSAEPLFCYVKEQM